VAGCILFLCSCGGVSSKPESDPYPESWPNLVGLDDCGSLSGDYNYHYSGFFRDGSEIKSPSLHKFADKESFDYFGDIYQVDLVKPDRLQVLYVDDKHVLTLRVFGAEPSRELLYQLEVPATCEDGSLIYQYRREKQLCGDGSCESEVRKYKKIQKATDGSLVVLAKQSYSDGFIFKTELNYSSWYRYLPFEK